VMADEGHFNARPANTNSTTHGVYSERRIRPLARAKKRSFLRRSGLLASRLTGPQLSHLNRWARLESMADLARDWIDAHGGLVREDGETQSIVKFVVSVENSGRLAMKALEDSLRASAAAEEDTLDAYLAATYGDDNNAA